MWLLASLTTEAEGGTSKCIAMHTHWESGENAMLRIFTGESASLSE